MIRTLVLAALLPALFAACTSGAGADARSTITVFAASSLRGALAEAAVVYRSATGLTLTLATDSSASLRTQIEQGAPADVFLSADTANPARLADAGLTVGAPVAFAHNRVTLVVPADNPASVMTPADLARPGVRIVAAADAVPLTAYALEVVARLAAAPDAPVGFASAYAANVVSREDNAQAVVTKIALGEGDAALVYATDARGVAELRTIELPPEASVLATYGGVVVGRSDNPVAARAFLEWLAGPAGQAILAESGFAALP